MPLAKPHKDEKEKDFIKRCMGDDTMIEEYPDSDQRLAVCHTQWENRKADPLEVVERKAVSLELDDKKEGTFVARIATLNVIDKDGDLTKPGAFKKGQEVLISAYQHGSWMGSLPVGKAVIRVDGDDVLAVGEFNLNTAAGTEHYEAVKFSGGLQEWSYGFRVDEAGEDTIDGSKIRVLKKLTVFEISPVLLGAGVDTGTLAIKSLTTYSDQAEAALAAVKELVGRSNLLAELRRKEGRVLSTKNRERMKKLLTMLSGIASDLKELLDATEPEDTDKQAQAVLLVTRIKRNLAEVT